MKKYTMNEIREVANRLNNKHPSLKNEFVAVNDLIKWVKENQCDIYEGANAISGDSLIAELTEKTKDDMEKKR